MSDVVGALFSIYKFIDGKKGAFKSLEHRFQIFRELEESRAALEDSLNRATAGGGDEQRPLRETLEKATARAQQLAEKMEAAEEQVSQGCPDQCLMSIGCGKQLFQMPEGLLEEINQSPRVGDASKETSCVLIKAQGGIGKSSLAKKVMHILAETCLDISWMSFVNIKKCVTRAEIVAKIVGELSATADDVTEATMFKLLTSRDSHRGLLVVDNCEDAEREVLQELLVEILDRCSQVQLLLTSRVSVEMQTHKVHEYELFPLPNAEAAEVIVALAGSREKAGGLEAEFAELCHCHPLQLSTVGAMLAKEDSPRDLLEELRTGEDDRF